MPSLDSMAQALFGGKRAETREVLTDATTRTLIGTAVTDSEDGIVTVDLGGDVTLPDDIDGVVEYSGVGIELPAGPSVLEGDEVIVQLVGGGPLKSPTVISVAGEGDRQDAAIVDAAQAAAVAWNYADEAHSAAVAAQDSADDAALAASAAQSSADTASASASQAITDAAAAAGAAATAQASANQAISDAATAKSAADAAATSASNAQGSANAAQASANAAQADATRANTAASSALTQLSIVEDVAGTLDWISSHGTFTPTADTTVDPTKVYYEAVGGDYVPIASPDPTATPQQQGWYELDISSSQAEYVMSHLAVTSAGLWVLPAGMGQSSSARTAPGYKMLLASDGAYLYDDTGHLVTTYSESITLDSSRPQYIGGENAYIVFYDSDDDGVADAIRIGGSNVIIGGQRLSEVLSEVSTASQRAETAMDICTIAITSTGGTVFKQNRGVSTTLIVTVFTGDGMRITDATTLHTRFGNGAYLQWKWKDSPEDEFSILVNTDPRIGAGGFTLTVSPSDISTQAIIDCDLIF